MRSRAGDQRRRRYRSGAFDIGARLGFGDGSGAACPCGNTGPSEAGCLNSAGTGAKLFAGGSVSVAADDLWFRAEALPTSKSTLLFTGTAAHAAGLGIPIGDGLLVCAGTSKRLSVKTSCTEGRTWWGGGMIDENLWPAGQTRYFQAWYRDPAGPCASTFNFSSAVQVTLTP